MGKGKLQVQEGNRSVARRRERAASETDYAKYDFSFGTKEYEVVLNKGLSEETVRKISQLKNEPQWMLDFRLKGLKAFLERPLPSWGADLKKINFQEIIYYLSASKEASTRWEDVPEKIKKTFDRLGIPEAEKKFLAGVSNQLDSEVVYHNIRKDLEKKGVVFLSMDDGLKQFPELVKEHFSKVVPLNDNKFASLNSAVWSGGSFVYIPKGVKVDIPLQAYFRINGEQVGQFERTLIIADEGSRAHYLEGCFTKGAPILTEEGVKPIEEIETGELVWTHQNRWKMVYHTQARSYSGNLNLISYVGDARARIEVTDEHPFLAVRRQRLEYKNSSWVTEWIKAAELQKGDYVAIPIDRAVVSAGKRTFMVLKGNGNRVFEEKELCLRTDADFFRLVGYYLAEGTTMGEHYVSFTFHEKERAFLDDVKELLRRYFGKVPWEGAVRNHGISLVLCSTIAARFFNREFGHYAHTKRLPPWVLLEEPIKQAELLKGLWRGDGSYMYKHYGYGTKRMYRINSVSEELTEQVRNLLLRQNIFASINCQHRKTPRRKMFAIYVGGSFLNVFGKLVDAQVGSETMAGNQIVYQKAATEQLVSYAQVTSQYAFVPIKRIEKRLVENVPVYNLGVETDESYVAHGIAVHNCTAPKFSTQSLHAAVVEVIVKKGAHFRYTTIQNWSSNVYNLVTKRAFAYENATVEWLDGNIGAAVSMKYPAIYLLGEGARGEVLSIALAGKGQHQDTGAKAVHLASNTTSIITSKSVSKDGGRASYRGLLKVAKNAFNVKSTVRCDALLLDEQSRSDTYPSIEINNPSASIGHEASVGKISEEQVFYLMSRGLTEQQALSMIVLGFIQPFTKSLPMEYALELNRLIEMEMENSVG
jgi:Fe-S cluster assembly protein SufB